MTLHINKCFLLSFLLQLGTIVYSQNLTQTIRGTVTDDDTRLPLVGAAIVVLNSDPLIGTSSDANGCFRLEHIPVGRTNLKISYLGYDPKTIPNLEINSGKESVLEISLQQSVIELKDIIVSANRNKGEAINDMSMVSSRSISVEETRRYTGGMDDPARVISYFAGVTSSPDGSSDIIVRGNSPKYLQWRIDGIEISSPYHMDDQNSSFGALTALNNSLLSTSDFHSGAFSPEYGNVLASIMDMKLRTGNNEKSEAALGLGILGLDLTLEGPLKNNYSGSYLVNYRYSTVSLIKKLGLVDVDGVVDYQDATFKIVLPGKELGTFSFFGLCGLSGFSMGNIKPGDFTTPGSDLNADILRDFKKKSYLLNFGINHVLNLNANSFINSSLYYSGTGFSDDVFESDSLKIKTEAFKSDIINSRLGTAVTYNNKVDTKNKFQIGSKFSLFHYNYVQSIGSPQTDSLFNVTDFRKNIITINNFISWKHSFNDDISFVAGMHNMNVLLNNKSTFEPRIALTYTITNSASIYTGYGKHSTMESVHNYFAKVKQADGKIIEPNKNLDLLKAHHFVLGFEHRFTENLLAKIEMYYQHLYDLPVENSDSSSYATVNEGINYHYVPLINKGLGRNYGIELTLERFFDKNFYYLLSISLYNSKYKALDGIWRNTQFNNNYLVNLLFGKEFSNLGSNNNQSLSINGKIFLGGGKRYIPLLRDENGNVNVDPASNTYWDYKEAYNNKIDNLFQLNISVSYKYHTANVTHEIFLDLMNITNNRSRISEYYDGSKPNKTGYLSQFGFFPNLMYRMYF